MRTKIEIIGAGGHGQVVLDIVRASGQFDVAGFLDTNPQLHGAEVCGIRVLGPPDSARRPFIVAIGSNADRQHVTGFLRARGLKPVTAIHPSASVSPSAAVGDGSTISAGAVLTCHCQIGEGTIVNTRASVDHHCRVGDFAHLCPGSILTGWVTVEDGAFVGSGATVIPYRRIGAWATVGAGAVVIRDIPGGSTVVGVPTRVLRVGTRLQKPE